VVSITSSEKYENQVYGKSNLQKVKDLLKVKMYSYNPSVIIGHFF